jgi:hypothetical protein
MPERVEGLMLCDKRVRVSVEYLRENKINSAKSPALLANLVGSNMGPTFFEFRDVPEVWAALGVRG